jgi:putative endonuclease
MRLKSAGYIGRNTARRCLKKGRKIRRRGEYFVYIVKCKKGTYYTGYTNNLNKRIKRHNLGQGAKYLRGKLPVKLVFALKYRNYKNALNQERSIKKLTRPQKKKMIAAYRKKKIS